MHAFAWMRKWRGPQPADGHAGALVHAAARGDSLDQLLDLGVQTLLEAAGGDRAGLWLSGERRGESRGGRVVESPPGPTPEQWKQLDVTMPFLRATLESPEPVLVDLGIRESVPRLGPLVGMHSAAWIPLRCQNRAVGLAMVASASAKANLNLDALRTRGEEIALAVTLHRDARRRELAAEELRAQLRLSRAILCGVSADSILPQIARAARQYVQAEFVALGGAGGSPVSAAGWDGAEEWRGWLRQEALLKLWRKVFDEGREFEITGEEIRAQLRLDPGPSGPPLDHLIAIPIDARSRTAGVLMAGFVNSEDGDDDLARLESYALLAASAFDREVAREERAAARRSLRQILEESEECLVVVDGKGSVCEASRAAAALLFSSRRLLGEMQLEDFFSPAAREEVVQWRRRFAAPDSPRASRTECPQLPLDGVLARGGTVRMHIRSAIDGLGNGTRMWLAHIEDREEQQTRREAEGRLEAEMAALVNSIESGVLLLDGVGKIRVVSERLGAIMGIEARRLLELGNLDALMGALTPQFNRPVETVARWRQHVEHGDEASWDEFELVRPTRKIVERFARPLFKPDGSLLGWLEVYRDITGQRLIQSKLLQTEKMAALGQLVSGIAHELNNPLTSIQGYAQLLLSGHSASDRSGNVRHISMEAERAGRIVKNLLLFSRETKPERRAVNLNEVIERTLALRSYELKLENIAVELMLGPGLPHTLADAAQLQQVILNLIVNAEQAIAQGRGEENQGGSIHIRTRRLAGDRIGMEVSDDGPGIASEIVSRIFDPFFTTKPAGIGTGLGLSIVYGIVQEHGGEVSVESKPGHGTTLTVELPGLPSTAFDFNGEDKSVLSVAAAEAAHSPAARATVRSERILVVEDEPTVAQLVADVLAEEGHRVDTLLDSREALGRLEKRRYGLVICDLKMPHLDGPGLVRALVRSASPIQHKLLFITGDTMSPRTIEFLKSSGLPYLAKPFLVEELKEVVRQALVAMPSLPVRLAASEAVAAGSERLHAVERKK
jgi:signal transduction histidine kinase/FixJ family two-component response regulator